MCIWLPLAAAAQQVTLRSGDGSIEVTGEVIDFDGDYWRITSVYGPLTIRADRVDCLGEACPGGRYVQVVRITGAEPSVSLLLPALIEAYGEAKGLDVTRDDRGLFHTDYIFSDSEGPLFRVEAQAGTSAEGFKALADGETDLALTLRDPDEAELAAFGDAQAPTLTSLAYDALVATAKAGTGMDLRDGAQAAKFAFPDAATGVPDLFRRLTGIEPVGRVDSDTGRVGLWSAGNEAVRVVTDACGILRAPSGFTITSGEYPLAIRHTAALRGDRQSRRVADILAFARSDAAQLAISERGFLPLTVHWRGLSDDGPRLMRAISEATGDVSSADLRRVVGRLGRARQASVVIGFGLDGKAPDGRQMGDLRRLIGRLVADRTEGVLILAGFSDAEGSAAANLSVSRSRARTVAEIAEAWLPADDSLILEPRGFGETFPVTCNDSEAARARNRRVEVWFSQR